METTEIDTALLPWVAMLDTGVIIRALGQQQDDRSPACKAFWDAMLAERRQMLASAPSIAEILRKNPAPMPRIRGFSVVGFDERAAIAFGKSLPITELKEFSVKSGLPMSYIKYDALIVACALRYGVNVLVSLDDGVHKLAKRCGLRCAWPSEFERKGPRQLKLVPRDDEREDAG